MKYYRLLTPKEFHLASWWRILENHGYDGCSSYEYFAPELVRKANSQKTPKAVYQVYEHWWCTNFGTPLHKFLYGVNNEEST